MTKTDADNSDAPRLLPWNTSDGKPCFLVSEETRSWVARMADGIEEVKLAMSAELLGHAMAVLQDRKATDHELRVIGELLTQSLGDIIRVGVSRGMRFGIPPASDGGNGEGETDEHGEHVTGERS
ncbi:hypothetical protein [Streptomyces sp. SPB074]|uniref:hypothetical protein n=1 Tax=Streptomyces sp. (strain SPB074) TaxID=465543 RepID=UPI001F2EA736|nr:hypothetical protein [Streptomyces sp. SPB074]